MKEGSGCEAFTDLFFQLLDDVQVFLVQLNLVHPGCPALTSGMQ